MGKIVVNVSFSKYPVVRNAVKSHDWDMVDDQEDTTSSWNLWWADVNIMPERIIKMKDYQKANHFPGMHVLHTKTGLANTLDRISGVLSDEYSSLYPQTWTLPDQWNEFQKVFDNPVGQVINPADRKTYIVKPASSCQGKGIYLARTIQDVLDNRSPQVAQRYLDSPFLIDGYKFDLRIYVLITSVDPLRIWLYDEGLVRLATTPYAAPNAKNIHTVTQHLTNYAINKGSDSFMFNTGGVETGSEGSKRTISWFKSFLDSNGHSSARVWGGIVDMINLTLLAAQPQLARSYRSCVGVNGSSMRCFEVLGLDVLLDSNLHPWLLEVNHSPSLTCDTPLDTTVKLALLQETMKLIHVRYNDRWEQQAISAEAARQRLMGSIQKVAAAAAARSNSGSQTPRETPSPAPATSPAVDDDQEQTEGPVEPDANIGKRSYTIFTTPEFSAFTDAMAIGHPEYEAKYARNYKLIFPPVDPSLASDALWKANRTQYSPKELRSYELAFGTDDEAFTYADPKPAFEDRQDAIEGRLNHKIVNAIAPPMNNQTGLPLPFYSPWDPSVAAAAARSRKYWYTQAVSEELIALTQALNNFGGIRAADAGANMMRRVLQLCMRRGPCLNDGYDRSASEIADSIISSVDAATSQNRGLPLNSLNGKDNSSTSEKSDNVSGNLEANDENSEDDDLKEELRQAATPGSFYFVDNPIEVVVKSLETIPPPLSATPVPTLFLDFIATKKCPKNFDPVVEVLRYFQVTRTGPNAPLYTMTNSVAPSISRGMGLPPARLKFLEILQMLTLIIAEKVVRDGYCSKKAGIASVVTTIIQGYNADNVRPASAPQRLFFSSSSTGTGATTASSSTSTGTSGPKRSEGSRPSSKPPVVPRVAALAVPAVENILQIRREKQESLTRAVSMNIVTLGGFNDTDCSPSLGGASKSGSSPKGLSSSNLRSLHGLKNGIKNISDGTIRSSSVGGLNRSLSSSAVSGPSYNSYSNVRNNNGTTARPTFGQPSTIKAMGGTFGGGIVSTTKTPKSLKVEPSPQLVARHTQSFGMF